MRNTNQNDKRIERNDRNANQPQIEPYKHENRTRHTLRKFLVLVLFLVALVSALYLVKRENKELLPGFFHDFRTFPESLFGGLSEGSVPKNQQASIILNDNKPYFTDEEITTEAYESYSKLDSYGRCGPAMACLSREMMPKSPREEIGMIKPTGWHTVKYPDQIADRYLYNRCHLIAWCLSGENANERNLITGTRYMNVQGMLPYEEQVANYLERTGNHVMYRVTPDFDGKNLLASGVLMEAYSVEDQGKGICFCVYCYNVQPGIEIDYRTGESRVDTK